MSWLSFSFSLNSCEPHKFNFYVNSAQSFNCSSSFLSTNFYANIYLCGCGARNPILKLNHIQASLYKPELLNTSMKDKIVSANSIASNENSFFDHRTGAIWSKEKRDQCGPEIVKNKGSSEFVSIRTGNVDDYDIQAENELDVRTCGVDPDSSVQHCNEVLRGFERCSDNKAVRFFEWMRINGKLRGNVTAHYLVLRVLGRKGDWEMAEKLIKEMIFSWDCELDCRVFNTIIYCCSKRGHVELGAKWFHMMFEYGVQPNIATFGMVMSLFQKDLNLREAEFAFCQMRKLGVKCQSAYSAMITIYTRLSLHNKAEEIIGLLSEDGVTLNLENWVVMLYAYSQQGKLEEAETVLSSMGDAGFSPNVLVYNILITGYGKSSNMDAAEGVFQNLQNAGLEPDETTCRSMIEGWARAGNYKKVKWYYGKLKAMGFRPNSSKLHSLIGMQAKYDDEAGAIETLREMVKMGCQPSSILTTLLQAFEKSESFDKIPVIVRACLYEHVLVEQTACSILAMAYVKHQLVDDVLKLLHNKRWKDRSFEVNLYHLLICSCKELGHLENAVRIFNHMPLDKPNLHVLCTMIDIYCVMNRFSDAERLYTMLKSSRVVMDMVAYSIIVKMYVKAGSLNDACRVLDDMDRQKGIIPDVYLYRDMLRVYQQCNKLDKLAELYYRILKSAITWDEDMYNCVINCCAHSIPVDELSRLFDEMIRKKFTPNTITYNVLLDVYGKSRLFKKARKIFLMARKQGLADVISYNTLIAAYGKSKDFKNMTATVQRMQFDGFSVSLEAYNCMLDAYGKERQMDNFKNILKKMKESSCNSDQYTYNTLINIYGEQGWIEEVAAILTELREYGPGPDLCSYNTLIKAYGIAGMVEDAVSMVREMRANGIDPDRVTYINLISALKRNDKFLEAVRWSLWMKQMGLN